MTPKILRKIKSKYKYLKLHLERITNQSDTNCIKARNKCNKGIKKTHKRHKRNIDNGAKENPKSFWKYVQEQTNMNTGAQVLKNSDGSLSNSDELKANTLNSFFYSVFTREDTASVPNIDACTKSRGAAVVNIVVTPLAVQNIFKRLNTNKAQGPDGIPPRGLKEISKEISKQLCHLFKRIGVRA